MQKVCSTLPTAAASVPKLMGTFAWNKHAGFMGSLKILVLKTRRQVENEAGEISRPEPLWMYMKTGNLILFFFQVAMWDVAALGKFHSPFKPLLRNYQWGLAQVRNDTDFLFWKTLRLALISLLSLLFSFSAARHSQMQKGEQTKPLELLWVEITKDFLISFSSKFFSFFKENLIQIISTEVVILHRNPVCISKIHPEETSSTSTSYRRLLFHISFVF